MGIILIMFQSGKRKRPNLRIDTFATLLDVSTGSEDYHLLDSSSGIQTARRSTRSRRSADNVATMVERVV